MPYADATTTREAGLGGPRGRPLGLPQNVDRDHPHGVRAQSGYRRVYVSDQLDRLYGEYVWQLCEAGADLATDDFDAICVFVKDVHMEQGPQAATEARGYYHHYVTVTK